MPGGGGDVFGPSVADRPAGPTLTDDMYTAAARRNPLKPGGRDTAQPTTVPPPFLIPTPASYIVSENDGDEMRQFFR